MRKGRVLFWILCLIVSGSLFLGEQWFKEIRTEKLPLYVYAPKEMEEAFKVVNKIAGLKKEYKIVITDDISKANIIVDMGKEFDSTYTKFAYSPFVVAYSSEDGYIKKMVEKGMLKEAFFDKDYKEINFAMVIKEVIEEGKWENLGVKNMGDIKVYYPAFGTKYYNDYYDFMLVTINEGSYPKDEKQLKRAMEQIELFESSNYTEGVKDFDEKINRTGGFMENSLYLITEQQVAMLANRNTKYGRLFYPTTTIYANYYVKADDLGSKLVANFERINGINESFYLYIARKGYRNYSYNILDGISDYLYNERNVYNILHLEEERIRPENIKSDIQ